MQIWQLFIVLRIKCGNFIKQVFFILTSGRPSVNRIDLQALTVIYLKCYKVLTELCLYIMFLSVKHNNFSVLLSNPITTNSSIWDNIFFCLSVPSQEQKLFYLTQYKYVSLCQTTNLAFSSVLLSILIAKHSSIWYNIFFLSLCSNPREKTLLSDTIKVCFSVSNDRPCILFCSSVYPNSKTLFHLI